MHALVGARRNFCNVIFLPRLSSESLCVPVVKREDPTLTVTDKEANIGHPQFSVSGDFVPGRIRTQENS